MGEKAFRHDSIVGLDVEQKDSALIIRGAKFANEAIDYSNEEDLKRLATRANQTADGLFDLIAANCNMDSPDISPSAHLEMYLSLAGLACEIYFKSLIYFDCNNKGENLARAEGHKFEKLFNLLSAEKQETIKERVKGIEELLPELSYLFPHMRYDFELNHIQGEYLTVFNLMQELKILSNSNPAVKNGSIRFANGTLMLT